MSPQLHTWVYGFFPHSFIQQVRGDGFRAVVFMGHGLWVAFFIAISLISVIALWRMRSAIGYFRNVHIFIYLCVVLFLCKSSASLIYAAFVGIALVALSPKVQSRLALVIVIVVMSYPILSIERLFPHEPLLELVSSISEERAESLAYRFGNEHILLDKAMERSYFGWGNWGRNHVYEEGTTKSISVTDGQWILVFGTSGWFGFLAEFGLIFLTVIGAVRSLRFGTTEPEKSLLAAHSLIVAIIFLDQIPNASINPLYWLIIGSLYGRIEHIKQQRYKVVKEDDAFRANLDNKLTYDV